MEDQLQTGQPNSTEEVKDGETTKRSLGQPSSHKDKNSLDDQLITGKPFSIEKVEDEKKKKKKKFRSMKLSQR